MGFFTTIVLESLELGSASSFNRNEQAPNFSLTMALNVAPVRDTKWLTLEVCRQFQRGTCSRSDEECKFAHPPKSCQVENGRVIACFDSLKVRERTSCVTSIARWTFPTGSFSLYFCSSLAIDVRARFVIYGGYQGDCPPVFCSRAYINVLQIHI